MLPLARSAAVMALIVGFAAPVFAGPTVDKATEIEAMLAAGDTAGAMAGAQALLDQVWADLGVIGFTNTVLVAEPANGFGNYIPRADAVFKVDEPIMIYAEPYGFGYGEAAPGVLSMGFDVDLKVTNDAGEVLGELVDLMQMEIKSSYKNKEFQANLTYTLTGLPPGKYVLLTTMRDKNSDRTGSFETAVEFVAP